MPVRSMTLTTGLDRVMQRFEFQMPVRSMTLTTVCADLNVVAVFQMPVRSMTLTTFALLRININTVSDACQINDFDHKLAADP